MKTYKMMRPGGEDVAVTSFRQAKAILISFRQATYRIAGIIQSDQPLTAVDRELGSAIPDRWNANMAIMESMENDPEFVAASEDVDLFKTLAQIHQMAASLEDGDGDEPT